MRKQFDYDESIWGREAPIRGSLFSSGSLILEGVLSAFEDVSGKVLEVGCGGGQFTRALARYRPDLELVGVDIGKSAIKFAKAKNKKVRYILGDAKGLPFKDKSFDALYSIEVIEHVKEFDKVISEMARVLKGGSTLYLSVSCEKSLWTIPGILGLIGIDLTSESVGHVKKLSYDELIKTLKRYGFVSKRRFYFGHLIRQVEDLFYFLYLKFRKRRPGDLWAKYSRRGSFTISFIFTLFKIAILFQNIESKLLWWLPGISVQIEARKLK